MTARIIYATCSAPDNTSPAKMYWRCSCGGDGVDVPGAQLVCPGCGETVRIPDNPTLGLPLLDPRFDLRELAYRVLTNPDLSLFGHKNGGVGLYCRACTSTTIAFLSAEEAEHRPLNIAYASSVSGLWAQAAIHLAIHHGQEAS